MTTAPSPDLRAFDWLLLNTSGGKDSQTTLHHVLELARKHDVLDRIVAVHADLGEADWPGAPELAAEQVRHYNGRLERYDSRFELVHRVTREGVRQPLVEQIEARGMFPDMDCRYCTSDQKRGPIMKVMTRLAAETRKTRGQTFATRKGRGHRTRILNIMGLRAEESPRRAKMAPFTLNEKASNSVKEVYDWLPLHEWNVADVWADIRRTGVPYHPAYDLGMPRLSCRFCIFSSKSALTLAAQVSPDLARRYLEIEEKCGHRFKNNLSMAQIVHLAETSPRIQQVEDWAA